MEGKVALITGSAKGLGRAFAEALLEKGAKVCISDVNQKLGRETEQELQKKYNQNRVFFQKCDVTSEAEFEDTMKTTVSKFGGLDILCNNAGIANEKHWEKMLDINLTAMIRGTLLGLKYMGTAGGRDDGVIINVSSAAGVLPMPFGPMYTASKHGVVGLTRCIGVTSRKSYGVRVNCLCPSFTQTDIIDFTKKDSIFGGTDKNIKGAAKMLEMLGIMQPKYVAENFIDLVENKAVSAAVMLVTPEGKGILQLPKKIPDIFEFSSRL